MPDRCHFHESDGGPGIARIMAFLMRQLIWGLVVINEHDNHDRQRLDSSLVYVGAHNVYYVKCDLSDAKRDRWIERQASARPRRHLT